MNQKLLEEILRMHEIVGLSPIKNIDALISEAANPIPKIFRGFEKLLDRDAILAAERILPASAERDFEKRIATFVADRISTDAGKQEIRNLIKRMSESSPTFAKKFVEKNKSELDKVINTKGLNVGKRAIKMSFGDNILNQYEQSLSRGRITPPIIPPSGTQTLPGELKDSNGVKKFQDWMNENHPNWVKGSNLSPNGKAYGNFGPSTKKAWEEHSAEYKRFLSGQKIQNFGLNTEDDIQRFQLWMEETGRWDENMFEQNYQKGLTQDTQYAWNAFRKPYRESLGFKYNLELATQKVLSKDIKPRKGGWWDSSLSFLHPAAKNTVFNSIRKSLWFYIKSVEGIFLDKQSQIDDLISKFLTAYEKENRNYEVSENLFRDISIQMASMRTSAEQSYVQFLKDVQKTLIDSGLKYDKVNEVMNNLKTYSAYDKLFKPGKTREEGYTWANELWQDSVFMTFFNEVKTFYKQFFIKLLKFIERTLMFLTTGHIRTLSEITEFCVQNGISKGMIKYIGILYFMKFIALPSVWGTLKAGKNFINNIYDKEEGWWAEDTEALLKRAYGDAFEPWKKLFGEGDLTELVPWNWLWDDLLNKTDKVARQEIESKFETKLNQLQQQYNLSKQQCESLKNVFKNKTEVTAKEIEDEILKISKNNQENKVEPSPEPSPKPSPSSDDEFIPENTMKNNLQQRIHSVLKERLNEQKTLNNPFKEKLDVLKTKTQNLSSGLPSWTGSYPCLSDRGQIVKTTSDDIVAFIGKESKQYFYKNMNYLYKGKKDKKGKWSCNNGTLFIKTDDGTQWEKSTGWVDQPKTKKDEPKKDNTSNKKTKQSKYTKCSEELPIKQYCKNETIRKVQACLKMPKRYQTGNFGPITQEYLESRDQNGTTITTETILNICGSKNPLASGSTGGNATGTAIPYSSGLNAGTPNAGGQKPQSKTGYEDYTVDEIEYSNDTQNTKSSTPSSEKPEGAGTGYESYSEEKPNQPVSPSTPPATGKPVNLDVSSKKSFYNPQNPDNI